MQTKNIKLSGLIKNIQYYISNRGDGYFMKKIIVSGVHVLLILLSLINMYLVIKGPDYYTYIYAINDAISIIPHINGFIAAFVCAFVFAVIDCVFMVFHIVKAIKGLWHKESIIDQLLKTIYWCMMALIAIISFYLYFKYFMAFIT